MKYNYIVSSHLNPTLSGVAKFNNILSRYLDIPCIGFSDIKKMVAPKDKILISVKMMDLTEAGRARLIKIIKILHNNKVQIFPLLHTFNELPVEYELVDRAEKVFCANKEIMHSLRGFKAPAVEIWCPHLVDLSSSLTESKLNIFTFGMAHKLQVNYYQLLQERLRELDIDYSLWVSTAFHEKASFGDFHNISNQLSSIFSKKIQFLGFLSDDAINYFIDRAQLFTAFFPKGVRANNTSIYVPMKKNRPVLTNLDIHSPSWMKSGKNILDINRLKTVDLLEEQLMQISSRALIDVEKYANWDRLISKLNQ